MGRIFGRLGWSCYLTVQRSQSCISQCALCGVSLRPYATQSIFVFVHHDRVTYVLTNPRDVAKSNTFTSRLHRLSIHASSLLPTVSSSSPCHTLAIHRLSRLASIPCPKFRIEDTRIAHHCRFEPTEYHIAEHAVSPLCTICPRPAPLLQYRCCRSGQITRQWSFSQFTHFLTLGTCPYVHSIPFQCPISFFLDEKLSI